VQQQSLLSELPTVTFLFFFSTTDSLYGFPRLFTDTSEHTSFFTFQFFCFPIFTARCYASAVLAMGLCLSVRVRLCPSVTNRSSTKTAKRTITQTTPHDSPGIGFLKPKVFAKFNRSHRLRGRQMQVGWVKIGDFRQITGYISKTVQDRRMVSIKVE